MDFAAEEREHLVERSRALLTFAVFFYPALYPLDRLLLEPDLANLIGLIRLGVAGLFVGFLLLLRTAWGQRRILPVSLAYALVASLGLALFCLIDQPWTSPYFVGLIMVMFGACLFLPWGLGPAAAFCGASIGVWAAVSLGAEPPEVSAAGPAIFLVGSAVIAVLATHLNARARHKEFETRRALAELTEARTRFFANVSHELRTPLMLLLGPLQELRSRRDEPLLQAMEANAVRLQRQVELLLDAARLEDGSTEVRPAHGRLDRIAEALVQAARPYAEREGVSLETDLQPLPGRFDPTHAETIVGNLLANALKFTGAGGRVLVRGRRDGEGLHLTVEDTGEGIDAELLPHIFERFRTGERPGSGTGLGLHLSQELARLMEGSIRVSSEPGQGSAFTLVLPASDAEEPVEPAALREQEFDAVFAELQRPALEDAEPDTSPLDGARVMVVEDNPELRAFLVQQLSRRWEVIPARDGVEALQLVLSDPPDLVVSDVAMPRMDGLELTRRIREKAGLARTPVLLLTARGELQDVLDGYGNGANDYVVKPFNVRELEARIDGLLRLVELEDRLALTEDSLAELDMVARGGVPTLVEWVQDTAARALGRARPLRKRPVRLGELVAEAARPIVMPGVVLELDDRSEGTVHADPQALGRALEELVLAAAEAARYDEPKEQRRVKVTVDSATTLRIVVPDEDLGAPVEMARRLLAPLRPGQAAMVRDMLALHGGEVKVDTTPPEGGVAFTVTLPGASPSG